MRKFLTMGLFRAIVSVLFATADRRKHVARLERPANGGLTSSAGCVNIRFRQVKRFTRLRARVPPTPRQSARRKVICCPYGQLKKTVPGDWGCLRQGGKRPFRRRRSLKIEYGVCDTKDPLCTRRGRNPSPIPKIPAKRWLRKEHL
jgi:hypothetical protein